MRLRSMRWLAVLGSMLVMVSVGAGAQAPAPIGAEALEKVKKFALASKSSILLSPGVKRAFGLSENQRVERRQIGVELGGQKHFLAARVGDFDDLVLTVQVDEKTTMNYFTNSKLKLRGVARSIKGDQFPHMELADGKSQADFEEALAVWAQLAETLP
jgi:hypothetical protein